MCKDVGTKETHHHASASMGVGVKEPEQTTRMIVDHNRPDQSRYRAIYTNSVHCSSHLLPRAVTLYLFWLGVTKSDTQIVLFPIFPVLSKVSIVSPRTVLTPTTFIQSSVDHFTSKGFLQYV